MPTTKGTRMIYRCSFCGKSQAEVRRLIAGPGGVYICDACVDLCREIIDGEVEEDATGVTRPTSRRVWTTAMKQKWEYCSIYSAQDGSHVRFYGETAIDKTVESIDKAVWALGQAEWELVTSVDGSVAAGCTFRRPVHPGRALDDAAAQL